MLNYSALQTCLQELELLPAWQHLITTTRERFSPQAHGDMPNWLQVVANLPDIELHQCLLDRDTVTLVNDKPISSQTRAQLNHNLQMLHPWRKGPFDLFGVMIDTEWRSDLKWRRVYPHLHSLQDKSVLDIGCGSGYHVWRMLGAGARYAIGVEPSLLFNLQFNVLNHYIQSEQAFVLPLAAELLPDISAFDTVFSMGVLYHRPSPIDHLAKLLALVKPGGQLVVETLVLEQLGDGQQVLCPQDRYAQMRNVWFIPNIELMLTWMNRCGIVNARVVDINQTSSEEQRQTEWMRFHSLDQFLDPQNPALTVEGYPAPRRAVFIGEKRGVEKKS